MVRRQNTQWANCEYVRRFVSNPDWDRIIKIGIPCVSSGTDKTMELRELKRALGGSPVTRWAHAPGTRAIGEPRARRGARISKTAGALICLPEGSPTVAEVETVWVEWLVR